MAFKDVDIKKDLPFLLGQDFYPNGVKKYTRIEEPPEIVKDIIERIKKEEGLTYGDAYGILLVAKEYLEYEANFISPIFLKKELE